MTNSRKLSITAALIAAVLAGPAFAAFAVDYYDGNGQLVGQQFYCDNGQYQFGWGVQTGTGQYRQIYDVPC